MLCQCVFYIGNDVKNTLKCMHNMRLFLDRGSEIQAYFYGFSFDYRCHLLMLCPGYCCLFFFFFFFVFFIVGLFLAQIDAEH